MHGTGRDPSLVIAKKHLREDLWLKHLMGGSNCARITVPLVNVDQIRAAASVLRQAADELDDILRQPGASPVKVLAARSVVSGASRTLKGGIAYKGAR